MKRVHFASLALTILAAGPVSAGPPAPVRTLEDANTVLVELADLPLKGIPPVLLADAQGVAIIPRVIKAGFILGGRSGHGIVLARDKAGAWGDPVFVDIAGASIGFQAGVDSTDVVLVFRSRKSLDRLLEGKEKVTLGADAAVAAGPIGRQAAAATDGKLEAEIVSYSRARGLFAGVSLDGAAIMTDRETTARFQKDTRSDAPKQAEAVKARLNEMSRITPPPPIVVPAGPALPLPPPTPPAVLGPPTAPPKQMPERAPPLPPKE